MLEGKTALVTGSTSGIGQAIAKALAAVGADIVLNGFGETAEIESLRAGMAERHGVAVSYSGADMSKPEAIRAMIAGAGKVDVLVNNAGIQHVAPVDQFPEDRWDAIIAINLSSCFHTTKAALPGMRQRGWGRIVNIASAHGLSASAGKAAYVAAKHGVIGLTRATALDAAGGGITCNAICPGWVLTPLVAKQIDARAAEAGISWDEAKQAMLAEKTPSREFATPEQIGGLAVFLCSAAADQITGTPISIDGGWMAQ